VGGKEGWEWEKGMGVGGRDGSGRKGGREEGREGGKQAKRHREGKGEGEIQVIHKIVDTMMNSCRYTIHSPLAGRYTSSQL